MYNTVPSLPFKLPCVFLSSSFHLFVLSLPLFPLSYLSISPGFTPPHPFFFSPASNLLSSLLTRASFPSLIFFVGEVGRWGRGRGGHARRLFPCKSCCVFTTHPFQNPNGYHQQNTRVNHTSALRLCVRLCLDISLHLKRNEEEMLKKSLFALEAASLFSLHISHIFHTFLQLVQIW